MTARRPALIFDFGNVVAFFDYTRACDQLGPRLGLSGADFLRRVRERGLTPVLQEYERGRIACEEFSRSVCALAGLDIPHDEFAAAWSDIFRLNEPVADLVRDLKGRGYTLVLGSNTNALHAAQFRRQYAATLAHFDRLILSHEVGQIKPSAGFYHACAAAASAAPGDCVFIDDLPENVAGATAAGLSGVLYRDAAPLAADLRARGVDVGAGPARPRRRECLDLTVPLNPPGISDVSRAGRLTSPGDEPHSY